jgi:pimeloyl-ACP methyl ester carboxylesterase
LLIKKFNFFVNVMVRKSFGVKSRLTPEIHMHYRKPLEEENERIGCWVFPRHIINSTQWLKRLWENRSSLKDKGILIAWGMKDIAFRKKELNIWLRTFPDAHIIRYFDAGHFVTEEKGDELSVKIENFLLSISSQTKMF